jgi:peroxiredoxin Q/BCP
MKRYHHLFVERKTKIAVIVPHDADRVRNYWEKEDLPYTGIPDPEGVLGKLYRQQIEILKLGRMPALFVVDRKGNIAFAYYGSSMSDIPPNDSVLEILDSLSRN